MEPILKTLPNVDPEAAFVADQIEVEALRLFRVVNGPDDYGSERAFNCLNQSTQLGWRILAGETLKLKKLIEIKTKSKKANEPKCSSS